MAPPVPTPPAGTLLLVSEQRGAANTWAVGTGGGSPRPLADLPGTEFPGPPDPKGTHALVIATEDGSAGHTEQLWLVPLHAGAPTRLGPAAATVRNPVWWPDGGSVVVESSANSFRDLYRIPRTGGPAMRLTDQPHGSFEPDVSATGQVAFASSRDGNAEIYTMQPDGTGVVRLTDHPSDDMRPRWSPDGRQLTWLARRSGSTRVWRTNADGTGAQPLSTRAEGAEAMDHVWSPTGEHIALVVRPGRIEIVHAAKGHTVAVHDSDDLDEHPSWSPDGAWLAYTSGRGGDSRVVVATWDAQITREITAGGNPEWLPRWVAMPSTGRDLHENGRSSDRNISR